MPRATGSTGSRNTQDLKACHQPGCLANRILHVLQRVLCEACHDPLKSSLLRPGQLAFQNSWPFLFENFFHCFSARHRERSRGVKLAAIAEDQFNIFLQLLHCFVLPFIQFRHHGSEIHRVLNLIQIPVYHKPVIRLQRELPT